MENLQLKNFDFELNEKLIAQHPLKERDSSKLLFIKDNNYLDMQFNQLSSLLKPHDLLIFNNTKVIPTKLIATNANSTSFIITLHKQVNNNYWLAFIKNSKRLKIQQILNVAPNFNLKIINKLPSGEVEVELLSNNYKQDLENHGFMPLPPYIKRNYQNINNNDDDKQRYQSIFAQTEGAVASPTASLHFTNELISQIKSIGVSVGFVTLHVGAGTFLPVKTTNISEHKMHSEFGELTTSTINLINKAKQNNGRIISVGTTTLRVLEYVYKKHKKLTAFSDYIDLFIYPPYNFNVVDCLITNFHLPKSTLFMLICAFGGTTEMKLAYAHANNNNYRFFSYGDACFINKKETLN